MGKYTVLTREKKENGSKYYGIRIHRFDNESNVQTIYGVIDHWFEVDYFYYDGKRHQSNNRHFPTQEKAESFYAGKIKELETKIA